MQDGILGKCAIALLLPIQAISAKHNSEGIATSTPEIATLQNDDLASCGWGLSLASMAHETLYNPLFRS